MYIFAGLHVSTKHLEMYCKQVTWRVLRNIAIDISIPFFKWKEEAFLVTCNLVPRCKIVFSHFKSNDCSAVAYLLCNELGGSFFGDQFF